MNDLSQPLCDPFVDPFDHEFELDATDLSEWLDDHYESGLDLSTELDEMSEHLKNDTTKISKDIFNDERSTFTKSKRRRSSQSPSHRRSRQNSPQRKRRNPKKVRQESHEFTKSSHFSSSMSDSREYDEALNKLRASMKRSEMSRVATTQTSPQPASSTLGSLAGLLTGKRTSLTAGLEQSRRQMRAYMSLFLAHQTL